MYFSIRYSGMYEINHRSCGSLCRTLIKTHIVFVCPASGGSHCLMSRAIQGCGYCAQACTTNSNINPRIDQFHRLHGTTCLRSGRACACMLANAVPIAGWCVFPWRGTVAQSPAIWRGLETQTAAGPRSPARSCVAGGRPIGVGIETYARNPICLGRPSARSSCVGNKSCVACHHASSQPSTADSSASAMRVAWPAHLHHVAHTSWSHLGMPLCRPRVASLRTTRPVFILTREPVGDAPGHIHLQRLEILEIAREAMSSPARPCQTREDPEV